MDYGTFINNLRAQVGDNKRRIHVDFPTDGVTNVFQMPAETFPVYDDTDTYTVRLNGDTLVEDQDYTLDKVTGTLTLVSSPAEDDALTMDSYAVYLLNEHWVIIVNSTISSLGDDYFKEFTDIDIPTVADEFTYTPDDNTIAVYEFAHRKSTNDLWISVETYANWRYDRDNNVIYVGEPFTISDELLKIRGLRGYTQSTDLTDEIDVQERFHTVLEYGSIARYYRWRYKSVIELVSKQSTESTRTPLQELIMLSDRFDRQYELEKAKLKPQKPARTIPRFKEGSPRP